MRTNHHTYMAEALAEAATALAQGEFPVGCVIVHAGQVVARGRRRQSGGSPQQMINEVDHAEVLALRELLARHPELPPSEVIVYATLEPCLMCYATLLISGVRTIVYAYEDVMGGGTKLRLDQLPPLYQAMSISVTPHILRAQSLHLCQRFFSGDTSPYLRGSLLATYTLNQP